jgi:uncharacterized protein YpmS
MALQGSGEYAEDLAAKLCRMHSGGAPAWPGQPKNTVAGSVSVDRKWDRSVPAEGRRQWLVGPLLWSVTGVVVGVALTLAVLVWLAPSPPVAGPVATGRGDVAVTLDDTALTDLTASGIAQANLPFQVTNVRAHIESGNAIQVTGDVPLLGGLDTRQLSTTTRVAVENGQIVLHVERTGVGGLPLPQQVNSVLANALNARLASAMGSLSVGSSRYVVTSVSSRTGLMTIALARG